jgi:hypothetical protein
MLIENSKNTYQVDEIVSFKTISGDEVLGRLVSSANGAYELNKPCLVVTSPEGIGLIQAMFGLDPDSENLTIRDQHVITMCRTHEKMRDHYVKVVNTQG